MACREVTDGQTLCRSSWYMGHVCRMCCGVWSSSPQGHRGDGDRFILFMWRLRRQCPVLRRKMATCCLLSRKVGGPKSDYSLLGPFQLSLLVQTNRDCDKKGQAATVNSKGTKSDSRSLSRTSTPVGKGPKSDKQKSLLVPFESTVAACPDLSQSRFVWTNSDS